MNNTNDNVVNPNVTGTASNMRWSKGQTITGCVSGATTTVSGNGSGANGVSTPTFTTGTYTSPYIGGYTTNTWPYYVYTANPKEMQELKEEVEDLKDVVQDLASEIRLMRKELKRARKEKE